ncbi:MAG TPA: bifunctional hydroxymethylpyrimidine kinase/phosphomethylpyrimidine kinase [Candidatus Acidoferrales bacterium]|nr:bifunctional hydroxymethylpyrimidine kinase/phosphomethylpyrimidine kinase [Candidatus Acidoferrales bacterium]
MPKAVTALTIAGSDSGAGAGIQADLKTFAAIGVYGASVITAITAQNTQRVTKVLELPPAMVAAQIDAVAQDLKIGAVKTGMIANAAIIEVVAAKIRQYRLSNLVVDPVMVAKSGDRLLRKNAIAALRAELLPLAAVATPNLAEAEELTGLKLRNEEAIREAAKRILDMGVHSVIIKGGHRRGPAVDVFYDGKKFLPLKAPRIRTRHTHGTGCTFSAAIAAHLARGLDLERAVVLAKRYITEAIKSAFPIGSGHSPVHHFYQFWKHRIN